MHACLIAQLCLKICDHGLQPARLLCPLGILGKNTGMSRYSLLQGIFPIQGSNSGRLPKYMCVLVTQSCPTLCDPMDYSPPGSSVRGYWSGLPFPSPGKLLGPGIKPRFPTYKVKSEVTQLCLTLCNPMDCNLPGSPAHGIIQAWILEWVAILFSRGSSWPRDWTQVSCIAGRPFTIWATKESIYINK